VWNNVDMSVWSNEVLKDDRAKLTWRFFQMASNGWISIFFPFVQIRNPSSFVHRSLCHYTSVCRVVCIWLLFRRLFDNWCGSSTFFIADEQSETEQNPDELTNEEGVASDILHAASTDDVHAAVIRLANSATNIQATNCSLLSAYILYITVTRTCHCR